MSSYMTASELSQAYQSVLKPTNKPEHEISQVTSTDDKYEVRLSIHNFEPAELTVKVIDRYVHVEGRHEEKNDKIGFFTRQFTRRYFLPEHSQPESIRCTYCLDTHILTVTAPIVNKKPAKEIVIPIVIIGHTHTKHRDPNHHHREKEKEREGESRQKQPHQREHHHQPQHTQQQQNQQLHQPHPHQQQSSASVTATSSSTSTSGKKKNHQKQKHNHSQEREPDKYQHQMNF